MQKPEGRPIGRTILGTWLTAGVLALGYGLMVSGCAPVTPVVEPIAPAGEIDSLEKAEQAWRAEKIAEHEPIWNEENGPDGDPFSAGLAAFHLASVTFDPAWSNAAIDAFDKVIESSPGFTLARAWRGSAHALMARDYPVKGALADHPGSRFRPALPRQDSLLRSGRGGRRRSGRSRHPAHPRLNLSRDAVGLRWWRRGARGFRQAARLDPRPGEQWRSRGHSAFDGLA